MINNISNITPYKNGDKLILEIEITSADKADDFLDKALLSIISTEDMGFNINSVSFSKDRYVDSIPQKLRDEIGEKLQNAFNDISKLIQNS